MYVHHYSTSILFTLPSRRQISIWSMTYHNKDGDVYKEGASGTEEGTFPLGSGYSIFFLQHVWSNEGTDKTGGRVRGKLVGAQKSEGRIVLSSTLPFPVHQPQLMTDQRPSP